MRRIAIRVAAVAVVLLLVGIGVVVFKLVPRTDLQPLPAPLLSLVSAEGRQRLADAEASADYAALVDTFEAQALASYCGVATSVAVLNAWGRDTSQYRLFTAPASRVRSRWAVTVAGMTLTDLAGILEARGVATRIVRGDAIDAAAFRRDIARNLAADDDFLLVNYQRAILGQRRVGHISPIVAYDVESDSVLLMDTAAYRYPPTWIPVDSLIRAMRTEDDASGRMRGYVEVSRGAADSRP